MNMRETRWVRDDGMRDERFRLRRTIFVFFHLISIGARSPATLENLGHAFASLAHIAGFQRLHPWDEAGILDHESHQLARVAANIEELQAVLLDELLERPVRG